MRNEDTERWFIAAKSGDLDTIRALSEGGFPLETLDEEQSALHWAARNGHLAIVRYLTIEIEAGLRLASDSPGKYQRTAFLYAAAGGHVEVMAWLAEHDAGLVDAHDAEGRGALHLAAELSGSVAAVRWLVEVQGFYPFVSPLAERMNYAFSYPNFQTFWAPNLGFVLSQMAKMGAEHLR